VVTEQQHEGANSLGYSTSSVTPTSRKCIGSPDDIFVEEAGAPDLAWDERSTQNTNEKPNCD